MCRPGGDQAADQRAEQELQPVVAGSLAGRRRGRCAGRDGRLLQALRQLQLMLGGEHFGAQGQRSMQGIHFLVERAQRGFHPEYALFQFRARGCRPPADFRLHRSRPVQRSVPGGRPYSAWLAVAARCAFAVCLRLAAASNWWQVRRSGALEGGAGFSLFATGWAAWLVLVGGRRGRGECWPRRCAARSGIALSIASVVPGSGASGIRT